MYSYIAAYICEHCVHPNTYIPESEQEEDLLQYLVMSLMKPLTAMEKDN